MKKEVFILMLLGMLFVSCSSGSKLIASEKTKKGDKQTTEVLLEDSLINYGMRFLNTPYRYGGTGSRGFDCSGFTSYVFKEFDYSLPRSSRDQAAQYPTISRNDLKRGDLVFFEGRSRNGVVGHVGIVTENLGNGEFNFIHASTSQGVVVSHSNENYYASRYLKSGRVIDRPGTIKPNNINIAENKNTKSPKNQELQSQEAERRFMSEPLYHTVKKGESLAVISKKYGVPVTTIQVLNRLNTKRIRAGQRLVIEAAVEKPDVNFVHTNSVLDKNEMQAPELVMNNLKSESAKVEAAKVISESRDNIATSKTHVVRAGESLYSIARANSITVNQLKSMNGLRDNNIRAGQKLVIEGAVDEF